MRRGEFAETCGAQISRLRERHARRFVLTVEQQPQSKNISDRDAIALQRALAAHFQARSQTTYRGDVFLQLEFYNKSKTPPAIYSLPKNYLDLMGIPRTDSGIAQQRLLYRDDRQVKGLIVRYHIDGHYDKPRVSIRAEPFRDFLADADLVRRISVNQFVDDDDCRRSSSQCFSDGPFRGEVNLWDEFNALAEFESQEQDYLRFLSKEAFEAQRFLMRHSAQQEFLTAQDRHTCFSLLAMFQSYVTAKKLPSNDLRATILAASRNQMITPPLMLELHHAPRRKGDSEKFVADLEVALTEFKGRYAALFPLATMLNVTVVMVPPIGGGKDLDNLARLVFPRLHESWTPPSHFVHAACSTPYGQLSSHWQAERNAIPKQQRQSITEFRIFEIPRLANDPEEGLVRLAVGAGSNSVGFREEIDNFVEKWVE